MQPGGMVTLLLLAASIASGDSALTERANAALRSGDTLSARQLLEAALQSDPSDAWANFHLGRLNQMEFRPVSARRHFEAALKAAPNDPEVLWQYATVTADQHRELNILHRLAASTTRAPGPRQRALEHLELHRNLGVRKLNELRTSYTPVSWKLPVASSTRGVTIGWIVRLSVNGSRPLRMLLDTGSRNMLISRNQARGLGLEPLGNVPIGGFGEESQQMAQLTLADRVRIGETEWGNVLVEVAGQNLDFEVDGLLGIDLFRHFQLTLNGPAGMMELTPFEGEQPSDGAGEHPWSRVDAQEPSLRRVGHLLFAPAGRDGHFVLDSGAGVSVLHRDSNDNLFRGLVLAGMSGDVNVSTVPNSPRLSLGGAEVLLRRPVAMDLRPMSESLGFRIAGFLGYPVFKKSITTIDVRGGRLTVVTK